MNPRLIKSAEAVHDVIELGYYLARHSPAASERFLRAADQAFQLLAQMPELGSIHGFRNPRLADLRSWSIRGFKKYVVFYRIISGGVEIVRVLYGAQDVERILQG